MKKSRRQFLKNSSAVTAALVFNKASAQCKSTTTNGAIVDQKIVKAAIYPGIGVARVGNSQMQGLNKGFYIGPEVVNTSLDEKAKSQNTIRDSKGNLMRQAARFRIYGLNQFNQPVKELTADEAEINWQVELANKKASWYCFDFALDIKIEDDQTEENKARRAQLPQRNASVEGADRENLAITPSAKKISGRSIGLHQKIAKNEFNDGVFRYLYGEKPHKEYREAKVNLGEVKTDDKGRLLVLGGYGEAKSPPTKKHPHGQAPYDPKVPISFNNAAGWYDDIADGPVTASVKIGGQSIPVESSWVVVGPPNYAPDVIGWRTLYDLLVDTYLDAGLFDCDQQEKLNETSFVRDILPRLKRLTNLQWVNAGFAGAYGIGAGSNYFDDENVIAELSRRLPLGVANQERQKVIEKRQAIVSAFRIPGNENGVSGSLWPALYGDAYGSFKRNVLSNDYVISKICTRHFQRWARGDFKADWKNSKQLAKLTDSQRMKATGQFEAIENLDLSEQPDMLNRSALVYCLADAFHPGCELTWPMRNASLYSAPFRIRHQKNTKQNYGPFLNHQMVMQEGGPLYGQSAGDLTRWMAIPWQGDTVFCRSGYEPEIDPFLPSYWPARVPNHVLTEADYQIVMNTELPYDTRLRAFLNRQHWVRHMKGSAPQQILQMVREYGDMGIVEARPGIKGDANFPAVMLVEILSPNRKSLPRTQSTPPTSHETKSTPKRSENPRTFKVQRAGWENEKQLQEFKRIHQRGRNQKQ